MKHIAAASALKGYSRKPRSILWITTAFALLPLVIPAQVLVFSGGSWPLAWQVACSGYFLQELALSWSAAAAIFVVSRWSFVYFVLLSVYVLTTRAAYLVQHPYLDHPVSVAVTAFWFGVVGWFLGSTLKTPYLHPQLRWWTRPLRVPVRRQAAIAWQGRVVPVVVLDLSGGGAFVKLAEQHALPQRLGDALHFRMQPARGASSKPHPFTAKAEVAWVAAPGSARQDGLGLKFVGLSKRRAVLLKRILRDEAARHHTAAR